MIAANAIVYQVESFTGFCNLSLLLCMIAEWKYVIIMRIRKVIFVWQNCLVFLWFFGIKKLSLTVTLKKLSDSTVIVSIPFCIRRIWIITYCLSVHSLPLCKHSVVPEQVVHDIKLCTSSYTHHHHIGASGCLSCLDFTQSCA